MFPWSGAQGAGLLKQAEKLAPRTAEQAAHELAELRKLAAAETTFDDVLLSAGDRLSKARIARAVADAATPEGLMELRRVWRQVDALVGPGKSVLQTLVARYSRLAGTVDRMNGLLRRGLRTQGKTARALIVKEMDAELRALAAAKAEILASVEAHTAAVKAKLTADLGEEATKKLPMLTHRQVRDEAAKALDELETSLQALRKAADKGVDARPSRKVLQKVAEEKAVMLKAVKGEGPRTVLPSRIRALEDKGFGKAADLGPAFAREVKRDAGDLIPALEEIDDHSLMFMEALGVVAQASPDNAKLLRRFVKEGPKALNKKEMQAVSGFLGQLRGLMPEEVATQMKFMEGVFHKRAFEALADVPEALRSKLGVEMVHGPLWVVDAKGMRRQFGDGCMLLTGPRGQSAIVGLGEFKAGFDEDLLHQLFVRSDGRAANAKVLFTAADGSLQERTLTREFVFGEKTTVRVTQPPVYVYGRTDGQSPEDAQAFKEMVEDQMQSGREVWKMDLPVSAAANATFSERSLRLAVKFLSKKKPNW